MLALTSSSYELPTRLCRSAALYGSCVEDQRPINIAAEGSGAKPLYLRVADDITERIKSGELTPGTRLRSERDLAEMYEVAFHTIRGAMRVLRERGLVESVHGRGTFVKSQQA